MAGEISVCVSKKDWNVSKKFHELSNSFVLAPPFSGRIPFEFSAASLFPKQFGPWAVREKTDPPKSE